MNAASDPKQKNFLQNLIKNFSLDQKFEPASFFGSYIQRYRFPKKHKLF